VSTASTTAVNAGWAAEARAYWEMYLWHHRHPRTRLLHRIGSWTCIAGAIAAATGFGWYWVPLSIAVGYAFAFAGHYVVEKNRPLTLKHPFRAAICNWTMFGFELFWDVEAELARIGQNPPPTDDGDTT
jgi:hypothetical protein